MRSRRVKPLARELALAAACCAWPRTPAAEARIRELAGEGLDWDRFLRVLQRHRVWGLADSGLRAAGVRPPPEAAKLLSARAEAALKGGMLRLGETLRLQALLDQAGVRTLFVKGEGLGLRLFGRLGMKQSRDIDLLLAPEDLERAMAALEGTGYVLSYPVGLTPAQFAVHRAQAKDCAMTHPERRVLVELHWRLLDDPYFLPGLGVNSPTADIEVGGETPLRTLNDEDLFAYLCLHGASHGWSRLKWIAEVGAWMGAQDEAGLEALLEAAAQRRAGRAAGQAMLLAQSLLGLDLPPRLEARLRADRSLRRLEAMATSVIAHGGGEVEVPPGSLAAAAIMRSYYLLGQGWGYRLSVLGRQWRGDWDRIHIPLPRPLHGLYHLIRAPSWVVRRLRG